MQAQRVLEWQVLLAWSRSSRPQLYLTAALAKRGAWGMGLALQPLWHMQSGLRGLRRSLHRAAPDRPQQGRSSRCKLPPCSLLPVLSV